MKTLLLFPSSYFDITKVDEDLENEFQGALESDQFDSYFFGYEKWFEEEKLKLFKKPPIPSKAIYRGWMMKPDRYKKFYEALKEYGITLITDPKQYEKLHCFPNIYPEIANDTARMLVYPEGRPIDIEEVKGTFQKFIVKDYVKSVKGTNFPKYFDQDIDQNSFEKWMETFYEYRAGLFTGGICFKEYLILKQYAGKNNEYRIFVANGHVLSVSPNSGQGVICPKPPKKFVERFLQLGSPFYTIDIAELIDGSWTIIETGDGGVSGLSDTQSEIEFYRKLGEIFHS